MALTFGSGSTSNLAGDPRLRDRESIRLISGYGPTARRRFRPDGVGLSFKVSAVPFQAWTPDVYVGAPPPVTAFMSVGTKVAAFVALSTHLPRCAQPLPGAVAAALLGPRHSDDRWRQPARVTQQDVKRMLAYSSVANAGYMLVAITVATQQALRAADLSGHLCGDESRRIRCRAGHRAQRQSGTTLDDFAGLGRRQPRLAARWRSSSSRWPASRLTAGFIGKLYVFYAAVGQPPGSGPIGVLASVPGMFYYLRVIWAMYFTEPQDAVAPVSPARDVMPTANEQPPI